MIKTRILLVGQGAREHAIAKTLKKNNQIELFSFMKAKNPGIAKLSTKIKLAKLNDYDSLSTFIYQVKPHIAVIGPEDPLAHGIVDFLLEKGVPSIGPKKTAARIESSKSFTRKLMEEYNIPGLPSFKVFTQNDSEQDIIDYVTKLGKVAVKRDGLAGGKGVKLMGEHLQSIEDVINFCNEIFAAGESAVLEELLEGEEFSLQCFVSGEDVSPMPIAQDHKRAYEGDKGPNTGGMGSYSAEDHLLPFISQSVTEEALEIIRKTAKALKQETSEDYCGILYGGFMLTPHGLKLLEYNARFGDPEAMNVLPLLKTPLVTIFKAMINGQLKSIQIEFEKQATVCKYIVPDGYPESPLKDKPIRVEEKKIIKEGGELYYSSVNEIKTGEIITTSSRAIAIVGKAKTIVEAEIIAEKAASYVKGSLFHRKDVGTQELIQKRIDHLKELNVL
ncbi:MAG: phosphoribosylamine--glycine ligase [Candidatus Heimdallarchaeota archaeon]|nr:phosphoribosylamine--glycine ligase [Candidatus Heimdallarchaeota archaeon]